MNRFVRAVAVLSVVALVGAGCAFDPAEMQVPGTTVSGDTYPIDIQFANVLNLPPGAKVLADGVEVGNLTGLEVHDPAGAGRPDRDGGFVVAHVEIKAAVQLPRTTSAQLRQATPLGDVHIALTTPKSTDSGLLVAGDTIPKSQTSQAPQIEDTMAGLATAISGGTVQSFQDIVRQLNAALPNDPAQTARIFQVLGKDVQDLAADLGSVDALLDGMTATSQVFLDNRDKLRVMLTDEGVRHTVSVFASVIQIILMMTLLGPIARNAVWLGPLVQSLDRTAKAVVPVLFAGNPLDVSAPSNLKRLVDLIQNKLIPFAELGPKVNVTTAKVSAADKTDQIVDVLRMIGVVR